MQKIAKNTLGCCCASVRGANNVDETAVNGTKYAFFVDALRFAKKVTAGEYDVR